MSTKRTILGAAGLATIAALFGWARAQETTLESAKERYSLNLRITEATDDDAVPPTVFGNFPTKGGLQFAGVAEVLDGKVGEQRCDGVRFAFFGRAAGDWRTGKPLEALSIYLDDSSTSEQRRALAAVFQSDESMKASGTIALSTLKISIERPDTGPLAPATIKVGDRGQLEVAPLKGKDGKRPIAVLNGFSRFEDVEPIVLGRANVRFNDHGRELSAAGSSGQVHYARMSGTLKTILEDRGIRKD